MEQGSEFPERPIRVLIVDDEPSHVTLMRRAFNGSAQAYDITTAGTILEAQQQCSGQRPDVAIVDLMLPDGRGTELLASGGPAEFPVVILTSQGDERAAVQSIKAGAFDYVIKSATVMAEMPGIVRRVLREWQLKRESETARKALAESDLIFRQLAENIRDLFWLYDWVERKLLYVSPAYETVWGRPTDELIANPAMWIEFVHEDDRERIRTNQNPDAPGKYYDMVYRIVRPDGSLRWVHDRRFASFNEAGQFHRIVGVVEDVTDRQQATEYMQQQTAHLAHVARLSTMGELIAGIAHEVNQPLHTISNYASAISSALTAPNGDVPLDKIRKWNDDISKAVVRAADIIKRTRAYLSKNSTQRTSTNLNLLLEESVELVAFEARRQRTTVKLRPGRPSPRVVVDPVAIQQVVVNLLRNAFEAMEKMAVGDRIVVIRTSVHSGLAQVDVEDQGSGMSDDAMSRLFAAFYTSKPSGMGMGLAISKTIVEAHQGTIWASRNSDRGVTFHFTLPLDESDGASPDGSRAARA